MSPTEGSRKIAKIGSKLPKPIPHHGELWMSRSVSCLSESARRRYHRHTRHFDGPVGACVETKSLACDYRTRALRCESFRFVLFSRAADVTQSILTAQGCPLNKQTGLSASCAPNAPSATARKQTAAAIRKSKIDIQLVCHSERSRGISKSCFGLVPNRRRWCQGSRLTGRDFGKACSISNYFFKASTLIARVAESL